MNGLDKIRSEVLHQHEDVYDERDALRTENAALRQQVAELRVVLRDLLEYEEWMYYYATHAPVMLCQYCDAEYQEIGHKSDCPISRARAILD